MLSSELSVLGTSRMTASCSTSSTTRRIDIVEANPRLDVWMLLQCGGLAEGATTRLQWGEKGCQLARQTPDIWIDGARVPVVWDEPMAGAGRPWFECPACGRRCRYVYLRDVIACRTCHRLDYASRHLHRTVAGLHRIRRLRRKIGVDQRPFAPLPRRQRHHLHYHRIVAEITRLERGLVNYLGSINRDLDRRIRVRKAKGSW